MKPLNLRTKLALTPTLHKVQQLSDGIESWLLPGDVGIVFTWNDEIGKTGVPNGHFKEFVPTAIARQKSLKFERETYVKMLIKCEQWIMHSIMQYLLLSVYRDMLLIQKNMRKRTKGTFDSKDLELLNFVGGKDRSAYEIPIHQNQAVEKKKGAISGFLYFSGWERCLWL